MATAKCLQCGRHLSLQRVGPCPNCGSMDRSIAVHDKAVIAAEEGVSLTTLREYWERNKLLLLVVVIITIGSPFLGLVLAGWTGVGVGLVLSLCSLVTGFFAVTKVREITHR